MRFAFEWFGWDLFGLGFAICPRGINDVYLTVVVGPLAFELVKRG